MLSLAVSPGLMERARGRSARRGFPIADSRPGRASRRRPTQQGQDRCGVSAPTSRSRFLRALGRSRSTQEACSARSKKNSRHRLGLGKNEQSVAPCRLRSTARGLRVQDIHLLNPNNQVRTLVIMRYRPSSPHRFENEGPIRPSRFSYRNDGRPHAGLQNPGGAECILLRAPAP